MKTGFKWLGAVTFIFGAYLYSRQETPVAFAKRLKETFEEKKQAYTDLKTAYHDFKLALDRLKQQVPELEKALTALQREIEEAQFQIQPRIEEINKFSSKMK
ncbi:hypothetical protein ACFQ22_12035 [Lentilactobacillus raoultii]|uniref:Uncharacterized protein n=1 Tax=Lentilactobacillus raoultii TaxID=1987503 RepID=A0ABW3PP51_9LACO|nr:hypothetical protein [Lentilactobacillus raoultii]